ncbi:hypothetical protein TI05_06670 [Achromatium sp. WMS3]|nr:hypothetical protein TI05_06670 [Achromatium sp. WMS3]
MNQLNYMQNFKATLLLLCSIFLNTDIYTPLYAKDLLIGASVALSGKYARTGQEQLHGLQMWVEEVNQRGGLLNRKVVLRYYDDESRPETGAKLYEKLITDDKVELLVGPYSSAVTMAASTVAERHNIPMISAGASASEIWQRGFKNIFGLYTPANTYMDQILEFAKTKGLRRIALIYANTEFPRDVANGVRSKAKSLGLKIVFSEEYSKASTDFSSMIIKMKRRRPDMVIGGSYLPDSIAFMRQAKEYYLKAKLFAFAVGPGLPDFGTNLGKDANGVMGNTQWEPTLTMPGVKKFAAKYKAKYGIEAAYHAAGGYGSGQVLEAAIQTSGSTSGNKIRAALHQLDITTTFGRFKVDATGKQVGKPGYTIQWIDGVRHLILPTKIATKAPLYPFPAHR